MELNLELEHINCYDLVLDTELQQEETLEAIVPDACADIARIVDAAGQICLTGKQVREGTLSVTGTVIGWVLYCPEGGQELCRMEVKIPFTAQGESPQLHGQGQCTVVPCLHSMDARALNPRKILVRADIGIEVQAYEPQEVTLCRGISCDKAAGIQQRMTSQTAYLTAAVQEKEFTFYDELHLSAGPGGKAQILGVWAVSRCTEAKMIGSKLIFKGEAVLQIRYLAGGELCSMRCPMPFSQVIELEQAGESADCELSVCLTGLEWATTGEDGRTVNITLELLGQAVVRDRFPVTVLQDAYSTTHQMSIRQEPCVLHQLLDTAVRPQTVRELLETEYAVKHVVDVGVAVVELKRNRQESRLALDAELGVNVLYLDEQDEPRMLHRRMIVSSYIDLPPNAMCRCRCRCPGELFAVPAAGGVEVRFDLQFQCLITGCQTVSVVTNAALEHSNTDRQEAFPSVVLRMAAPGEDLWDIAKSCSTTQEYIRQANLLEEHELPAGRMLLIPGIR